MELSITALVAIFAGVGTLIIGLAIFVIVLLVQKSREHNRHMASLDEREMAIAQTQKRASRDSIKRPRAVLRRSSILPFNNDGWGNLPSVETINPPEPPSIPPHYAPQKPSGFVPKPKRLSWPFLGRRASGRAIAMRKIRVPVLSTVIESPKPSPRVPVLSGPLEESPSAKQTRNRLSSDQSLLKHHPAFRNQAQESSLKDDKLRVATLRRSLTEKPTPTTEPVARSIRSQSLAEFPTKARPGSMTRFARPQPHARTVSTTSQASGNPPDGGLPMLPLQVARNKSEAHRRSLLSRTPSNSSYDSGLSVILATYSSPVKRPSNSRAQRVAKQNTSAPTLVGPRPFRDTLTLHGKNKPSQGSINSGLINSTTPASQSHSPSGKGSSRLPKSSSLQSLAAKVKTAESVALAKASSPANSPFAMRNLSTPKRRSGSSVTPYGSPEDRRKRASILQNVSGNPACPKRQLSQASTRSSNGNPFQWDPAPMSAGKPSALKGSPSARKPGHRRQTCVRISLTPIVLGPPSRSPSPVIHDIVEESPQASSENVQNVGLGFSGTRSLPRPPSTSNFAPDLNFNATSICASLTANSPTLSMANFDLGPIGSPVKTPVKFSLKDASQQHAKKTSAGSIFSIPKFPSPCHNSPQSNVMSLPPVFSLSQPSNENAEGRPYDEMMMVSSPFEMVHGISSPPAKILRVDEIDTAKSHLKNPSAAIKPTRNFSSPYSAIPEEPSPKPDCTEFERRKSEDSPPCSPKTIPSDSCSNLYDRAAYNLPIKDTTIPEEPDTIDPAILSKDAFTSLNSPFDNKSGKIITDSTMYRNTMTMPTSSDAALHSMQPLIDAAFPSSPPTLGVDLSTTQGLRDSLILELPELYMRPFPSSVPSSPSPSPTFQGLPMAPSSPRPAHAQLPSLAPTIKFGALPNLSPAGPRGPPARSLRSSIQALRRMNSDTKMGGKAERRYANLGREDSIALPGEESWLEELDKDEEESWDEEKGRALVGDLGFDWEDTAVLDLESVPTPVVIPPRSSSVASTPTVKGVGQKERKTEDSQFLSEPSSPHPSSPNTLERSSSIWEDGEKFWASTPPRPSVSSPNKAANRFIPLSSSPVSTRSPRKRAFEVAKDDASAAAQEENHKSKGMSENKHDSGSYRKRSVLGVGTPNVKVPNVNIIPPSSGASLYDAAGFLR